MMARVVASVCLCFVLIAIPSATQQPIFRSQVDGVRIDVLVTARGKPVLGLESDEFEVRDNGVLQKVTVTPRTDLPVRVILTVDASRSVRGARLASIRDAARALLTELTIEDEAQLITFGDSTIERVPPTREHHEIQEVLDQVSADGETSLFDATLAAVLVGEREASRSLIMVFSDGQDTASFVSLDVLLETARSANVVVYGVWSGEGEQPSGLKDVVDVSGGRMIDASRSEDIAAAFATILREFRQRYLITFAPSGVTAAGWHRLDIRVRGANVRFRRGYFGR
jgi:Ca-activated chloride channel homolog